MAQAFRKDRPQTPSPNKKDTPSYVIQHLKEVFFFVSLACGVYFFISLLSYDVSDPAWSHTGMESTRIHNWGGVIGAWFADIILSLCGYFAYLFPVLVILPGWQVLHKKDEINTLPGLLWLFRLAGLVITLFTGSALIQITTTGLLHSGADSGLPQGPGGIFGQMMANVFIQGFNLFGSILLLFALFLAGITFFTGLSWIKFSKLCVQGFKALITQIQLALSSIREKIEGQKIKTERHKKTREDQQKRKQRKAPKITTSPARITPGKRVAKERQIPLISSARKDTGLPGISLLDPPPKHHSAPSKQSLEALSKRLEIKLADFGIEVEVVAVHPGPVVTRFEVQPAPGVKVSQISNLAKDLARSLTALSVRVVEIIPGKSVVGIEIPNESRDVVALSEIISSAAYETPESPLILALGKDIAGAPVVMDLAKMPHLLVAGTTGSGKSVAINVMILSLLYRAKPEEVRLIMIDPKMLELSIYEGIPHLLAPVVTDMKKAFNALNWCVAEMERRYRTMSALGVRNIKGYNKKVRAALEKGEPIPDPLYSLEDKDEGLEEAYLEPLPYIVVIVDELADMMMIVGKKVEQSIARLAQKARAAGIHLILATQRPSVDVLTGLIKSNVPARIAFQVSSKIDSRTILDQMGAESLLGLGDMLFLPPGSGVPTRVHGAFVDDHEVHNVVDALKKMGEPQYIEEIMHGISDSENGFDGGQEDTEKDALYDQAVSFVTSSRKASISAVQRRLKVGYNRAARMIEQMEVAGVVSPVGDNGMREVLAPPPPEIS
ncbi:MAG: DNA translocase FtsK [Gammaproteobacteria bacterium]|nr:MAG: DNA translocase FtsK [Gammaproteobacteria bacterium]